MKYYNEKEVKNSLYILIPFFSLKYIYSLLILLTIVFYNNSIPILNYLLSLPAYLLNYYILLFVVPVFYFFKIAKNDSIKNQLVFIIRNNFTFTLLFLITYYVYGLLIFMTKNLFNISNYLYSGNFCSTNLSYNSLDLWEYIAFLFLFYNILTIVLTFSILKFSKNNFLKYKKA